MMNPHVHNHHHTPRPSSPNQQPHPKTPTHRPTTLDHWNASSNGPLKLPTSTTTTTSGGGAGPAPVPMSPPPQTVVRLPSVVKLFLAGQDDKSQCRRIRVDRLREDASSSANGGGTKSTAALYSFDKLVTLASETFGVSRHGLRLSYPISEHETSLIVGPDDLADALLFQGGAALDITVHVTSSHPTFLRIAFTAAVAAPPSSSHSTEEDHAATPASTTTTMVRLIQVERIVSRETGQAQLHKLQHVASQVVLQQQGSTTKPASGDWSTHSFRTVDTTTNDASSFQFVYWRNSPQATPNTTTEAATVPFWIANDSDLQDVLLAVQKTGHNEVSLQAVENEAQLQHLLQQHHQQQQHTRQSQSHHSQQPGSAQHNHNNKTLAKHRQTSSSSLYSLSRGNTSNSNLQNSGTSLQLSSLLAPQHTVSRRGSSLDPVIRIPGTTCTNTNGGGPHRSTTTTNDGDSEYDEDDDIDDDTLLTTTTGGGGGGTSHHGPRGMIGPTTSSGSIQPLQPLLSSNHKANNSNNTHNNNNVLLMERIQQVQEQMSKHDDKLNFLHTQFQSHLQDHEEKQGGISDTNDGGGGMGVMSMHDSARIAAHEVLEERVELMGGTVESQGLTLSTLQKQGQRHETQFRQQLEHLQSVIIQQQQEQVDQLLEQVQEQEQDMHELHVHLQQQTKTVESQTILLQQQQGKQQELQQQVQQQAQQFQQWQSQVQQQVQQQAKELEQMRQVQKQQQQQQAAVSNKPSASAPPSPETHALLQELQQQLQVQDQQQQELKQQIEEQQLQQDELQRQQDSNHSAALAAANAATNKNKALEDTDHDDDDDDTDHDDEDDSSSHHSPSSSGPTAAAMVVVAQKQAKMQQDQSQLVRQQLLMEAAQSKQNDKVKDLELAVSRQKSQINELVMNFINRMKQMESSLGNLKQQSQSQQYRQDQQHEQVRQQLQQQRQQFLQQQQAKGSSSPGVPMSPSSASASSSPPTNETLTPSSTDKPRGPPSTRYSSGSNKIGASPTRSYSMASIYADAKKNTAASSLSAPPPIASGSSSSNNNKENDKTSDSKEPESSSSPLRSSSFCAPRPETSSSSSSLSSPSFLFKKNKTTLSPESAVAVTGTGCTVHSVNKAMANLLGPLSSTTQSCIEIRSDDNIVVWDLKQALVPGKYRVIVPLSRGDDGGATCHIGIVPKGVLRNSGDGSSGKKTRDDDSSHSSDSDSSSSDGSSNDGDDDSVIPSNFKYSANQLRKMIPALSFTPTQDWQTFVKVTMEGESALKIRCLPGEQLVFVSGGWYCDVRAIALEYAGELDDNDEQGKSKEEEEQPKPDTLATGGKLDHTQDSKETKGVESSLYRSNNTAAMASKFVNASNRSSAAIPRSYTSPPRNRLGDIYKPPAATKPSSMLPSGGPTSPSRRRPPPIDMSAAKTSQAQPDPKPPASVSNEDSTRSVKRSSSSGKTPSNSEGKGEPVIEKPLVRTIVRPTPPPPPPLASSSSDSSSLTRNGGMMGEGSSIARTTSPQRSRRSVDPSSLVNQQRNQHIPTQGSSQQPQNNDKDPGSPVTAEEPPEGPPKVPTSPVRNRRVIVRNSGSEPKRPSGTSTSSSSQQNPDATSNKNKSDPPGQNKRGSTSSTGLPHSSSSSTAAKPSGPDPVAPVYGKADARKADAPMRSSVSSQSKVPVAVSMPDERLRPKVDRATSLSAIHQQNSSTSSSLKKRLEGSAFAGLLNEKGSDRSASAVLSSSSNGKSTRPEDAATATKSSGTSSAAAPPSPHRRMFRSVGRNTTSQSPVKNRPLLGGGAHPASQSASNNNSHAQKQQRPMPTSSQSLRFGPSSSSSQGKASYRGATSNNS